VCGLRAPDLFLAAACERGLPGAWDRFQAQYVPRIRAFLRSPRVGADEAASGALADELLGRLFLPPKSGDTRTRLGTYDGRASLFGWLCTVARRAWIDERRGSVPQLDPARAESVEAPDPVADGGTALERDAEARRLRQAVEAAAAEALEALTPRQRTVLAYLYRDGANKQEAAATLGIDAAAVTRLVKRASKSLRHSLQRHGVVPAEAERGKQDRLWERVLALLERPGQVSPGPPSPS
jgi:RNA polymerase sigma-70 factor (ECF subfamily)